MEYLYWATISITREASKEILIEVRFIQFAYNGLSSLFLFIKKLFDRRLYFLFCLRWKKIELSGCTTCTFYFQIATWIFQYQLSFNGQTFNGIEDKINSASFPKVTFSAFLSHISWKNLNLPMSGYVRPALFPRCMANNWTRC